MTAPLLFRRRATKPRRRIVSVSNHWRFDRRLVVVQLPDGGLQQGYMPDDHPELVAFLQRAAAVAA